MATNLAQVRVTPGPDGHAVTCTRCDLNEVLSYRPDADELAVAHQRSHIAGTRVTQHAWAGLR